MITKIYGNAIMPTQNKDLSLNKSRSQQSFGMAYHLDSSSWSKTFDSIKEQGFIEKAIEKVKNGDLIYKGTDGIICKFKTENGEFLYGRGTKGLMPNLKFVPNNNSEIGFYIIDNGTSDISKRFQALSNLLDSNIQKQKRGERTSHPQQIMFLKNEKSSSVKRNELIEEYRRKQEILAQYARQLVGQNKSLNYSSGQSQVKRTSWGANISTRQVTPMQLAWASNSSSTRVQPRQNAWSA